MAKATGKDHSQINLDIWGDEAFLDLTPAAQHLYFVLWTSPGLSYCGASDWHPGRIAARARGWTAEAVIAAAVELSEAMFLVVDDGTGECLIRSWIKHDGLCRSPNMAVSMANARADLASRILRGVVVHEVSKIRIREPELAGWKRDAVSKMLTQKAVDPADLPPFNPSPNPSANPSLNPSPNPSVNPPANPSPNPSVNGHANPSVNPPANPGPTPAPAPAPISNSPKAGGYVSDHLTSVVLADDDKTPPRYCPAHPEGTSAPCGACGAAGSRLRDWNHAKQRADELALRDARQDAAAALAMAIVECDRCDDDGYVGAQVCAHRDHASPEARAAARATFAASLNGTKASES